MSKNAEYSWNQELQNAFDKAKSEIAKLVANGVNSFQVNARTSIVTD